jgi:hypothetical protein
MKTLAQQRLEQVHAEYRDLQSKEMELKAQAAAIEKKAREYNRMKAHKGDILAKLGSIDTKLSYVEYQHKLQALKANVNNVDDWKEEKEKIYKEYIELVFTPCKPRNWYCIDSRRWNNEARRYYIRIENYSFSNNNIERYDTTRKDYYIIIQERPELKRYKWEIETSWPDPQKYREDTKNITKYKNLDELKAAFVGKLEEVEEEYKKQNSELWELAPDIFDFSTIRTEVELPFEVEGKKVVKVKAE